MGKAKYKLEYFHVVAQLMKIRFMLKQEIMHSAYF